MTDENDSDNTSFRIPECNLETLQGKLEKLARRAAKLRLEPPRLVIESHEDIPLVYRDNMTDMLDFGADRGSSEEWRGPGPVPANKRVVGFRRYYACRLEGEAPSLPGWKLVAVIEHGDTELGNVLRVAPGMDGKCPTKYRQSPPWCDHCKTSRRRLETFLLLKVENESLLQVGRNCLADFCREPEAAGRLCGYAEIIASARGLCGGAEDEEFFGMGGRRIERAPVEAVLAMTARIIRHCGWCSRSAARNDVTGRSLPTANLVESIFFNPKFWQKTDKESNEARALREAAESVEERDVTLGNAALEWVRGMRLQAETLSDYLYNLLVVASEETVQKKHFGILCSAVSSYQKHLEGEVKSKQEKVIREASRHFGEAGKRGRWTGTVLGVRAFEGESYGRGGEPTVRYLYRFAVNDRDIACWWTGKELSLQPGDKVILVGSVKTHEEYKGTAQTVLTRCDVYPSHRWGSCPNCKGTVVPADLGKNCPYCRKRGLKMTPELFPANEKEVTT